MQAGIISREMNQMLETRFPMPLAKVMQPVVQKAFCVKGLDRVNHDADTLALDENFSEKVLRVMNVDMNVSQEQLDLIQMQIRQRH